LTAPPNRVLTTAAEPDITRAADPSLDQAAEPGPTAPPNRN
jgi:hypothetical protein